MMNTWLLLLNGLQIVPTENGIFEILKLSQQFNESCLKKKKKQKQNTLVQTHLL